VMKYFVGIVAHILAMFFPMVQSQLG